MMFPGGDAMNSIGEAIKYLRAKRGMSQDALAETVGVSRQAISNWENGKTQPDADTLAKLGALFDVSVDSIIKNDISEKKPVRKFGLLIPALSTVISVIHIAYGFKGIINPVGVMVSAMLASVIALIMYGAFESSIQNRDFTMIAGHKKADEVDLSKYERQLRTMSILVSCLALLLNVLYFLIYFLDANRQMTASIIIFVIFIVGLASAILIVNYKYKNRKK
jgi:DNA-binding XRE family transcriptional regulator